LARTDKQFGRETFITFVHYSIFTTEKEKKKMALNVEGANWTGKAALRKKAAGKGYLT